MNNHNFPDNMNKVDIKDVECVTLPKEVFLTGDVRDIPNLIVFALLFSDEYNVSTNYLYDILLKDWIQKDNVSVNLVVFKKDQPLATDDFKGLLEALKKELIDITIDELVDLSVNDVSIPDKITCIECGELDAFSSLIQRTNCGLCRNCKKNGKGSLHKFLGRIFKSTRLPLLGEKFKEDDLRHKEHQLCKIRESLFEKKKLKSVLDKIGLSIMISTNNDQERVSNELLILLTRSSHAKNGLGNLLLSTMTKDNLIVCTSGMKDFELFRKSIYINVMRINLYFI